MKSSFKHISLLVVLFLCLYIPNGYAQVGIGTDAPAASSALDITSTAKGFLPPRMNIASRNLISSPTAGLMIWCTNAGAKGELQVYNGSTWTNMTGGAPADIAIGDRFGGGFVVYLYQLGDAVYQPGEIHGLIVADTDQGETQWGCHGTLIGGTLTALNTGELNTARIPTICYTAGIAATMCNNLVLNGYSDWYLPSKDELNKFYMSAAFYFNLFSGTYWSSSESASAVAWTQNFSNGSQQVTSKPGAYRVRAFRSF